MSMISYKGVSEELGTNNLEHSQRHILTAVYKNKIREMINTAINNGDDISIDEDGNLLFLQTKFYIRKYEWDTRIQDFVKVRAKSRRVKKSMRMMSEDMDDREIHEEEIMDELVEETE